MIITAPASDASLPLDTIDLADTALYTSGDAHLVWQTLRRHCPVFWQTSADGPGFWAVTRREDVRRVLTEHATFSSEGGTAIAMLDAPDPAAGIMMQATDPPNHRLMRSRLRDRYSAAAVAVHEDRVRDHVRQATADIPDGESWDVAAAFVRLPMHMAALWLGLPSADVDPLLKLAYASLAPNDPRYADGPTGSASAAAAHIEIIEYFSDRLAERRRAPKDCLISLLMSMEINSRPLTDYAIVVNCLSLLLGSVVTTSQAISATMIALTERHHGEGRWPRAGAVAGLVEEALRWSSPVTHFMRRATSDVELHGVRISAGEPVTAWIASANRDETAFSRPYAFDPTRSPNRHLAFGAGVHLCLGANLARLMLRVAFEELAGTLESFETAGAPVHLVSNEIAGVVSLPMRAKRRGRGMIPRRLRSPADQQGHAQRVRVGFQIDETDRRQPFLLLGHGVGGGRGHDPEEQRERVTKQIDAFGDLWPIHAVHRDRSFRCDRRPDPYQQPRDLLAVEVMDDAAEENDVIADTEIVDQRVPGPVRDHIGQAFFPRQFPCMFQGRRQVEHLGQQRRMRPRHQSAEQPVRAADIQQPPTPRPDRDQLGDLRRHIARVLQHRRLVGLPLPCPVLFGVQIAAAAAAQDRRHISEPRPPHIGQ